MRVVVAKEIAGRIEGANKASGDAGASLAVRNFLVAIESEDSLLSVVKPLTGCSGEDSMDGPGRPSNMYSGDIVLEFREPGHIRQKSLHFLLLEKLTELLKEDGSQESLEATLCLTQEGISVRGSVNASESQEMRSQEGMVLRIRLTAKGDSREQALLRWGLGLAHVQQALLFTSRHLRLRLTQTDG